MSEKKTEAITIRISSDAVRQIDELCVELDISYLTLLELLIGNAHEEMRRMKVGQDYTGSAAKSA